MEDRGKQAAPFDEQAALEELERVRQEIERYKQQRKALGEEFEQFTRSFKNQGDEADTRLQPPTQIRIPPPSSAPQPAMPAASRAPDRPAPVGRFAEPVPEPPAIRSASPSPEPMTPATPPLKPPPSVAIIQADVPEPAPPAHVPDDRVAAAPLTPPPLPEEVRVAEHSDQHEVTPDIAGPLPTIPAAVTPSRPQSARRGRALAAGLALLVVGGLAAWTFWPSSPDPSSAGSPPYAPAPAPPPEVEPPAPAAAAVPATPQTEITTTAAVWLRVVADGETVLERELPADSRVPITAEKTIVIRTGDAGAVRLTIAGQDQGALGRAGEVVTRSFTVPAPVAR